MTPLVALGLVIKHFSPKWFSAILREAERAPATVAAIFFVWVTVAVGGVMGYFAFNRHAEAEEQVRSAMQATIAANTKALNCNLQDRKIARKTREINNVTRLIDQVDTPAERRDLQEQLDELERELRNLEKTYDDLCLK